MNRRFFLGAASGAIAIPAWSQSLPRFDLLLKDGHVIAFETRETPARGRETTFLQELLKATPGSSATNIQETNPGNGGGPIP